MCGGNAAQCHKALHSRRHLQELVAVIWLWLGGRAARGPSAPSAAPTPAAAAAAAAAQAATLSFPLPPALEAQQVVGSKVAPAPRAGAQHALLPAGGRGRCTAAAAIPCAVLWLAAETAAAAAAAAGASAGPAPDGTRLLPGRAGLPRRAAASAATACIATSAAAAACTEFAGQASSAPASPASPPTARCRLHQGWLLLLLLFRGSGSYCRAGCAACRGVGGGWRRGEARRRGAETGLPAAAARSMMLCCVRLRTALQKLLLRVCARRGLTAHRLRRRSSWCSAVVRTRLQFRIARGRFDTKQEPERVSTKPWQAMGTDLRVACGSIRVQAALWRSATREGRKQPDATIFEKGRE
jgi:hypothetical protein